MAPAESGTAREEGRVIAIVDGEQVEYFNADDVALTIFHVLSEEQKRAVVNALRSQTAAGQIRVRQIVLSRIAQPGGQNGIAPA